ncbi:hypothetical protein A33I_06935 [Alkalihalophilus marmarensis DSM 21297]|jgi:hypothetical protein|uniref:Uncharacterized protein n=1 Tax=Alkalihalophilus marmarensis DSM 21297 TaxID=1188261 RepID=U6SRY6_9BACI|nr:hypothetical protein A33I_06935 [Alkalihalophilus marmarensis DSM 21297]
MKSQQPAIIGQVLIPPSRSLEDKKRLAFNRHLLLIYLRKVSFLVIRRNQEEKS